MSKPPNPFEFGRDVMTAWEKSMGDTLKKLSRDEGFLKYMGSAFGQSMDFRKQIDTCLQNSLEALHLPTKDDITRVLEYLLRLEQKALDLEDRIENIESLLERTLSEKAPAASKDKRKARSRKRPAAASRPSKPAASSRKKQDRGSSPSGRP